MATCLSQTEVDKAAKPGKLADGEGLYLDVRSATSASWLFKFTFGKPDEMGLGSRKKVTLARARELRGWAIAELAAGRNPRLTLKQTKLELVRAANAPKAATVYELARDNVTLIAKKLKTEKGRTVWVRSLHRDFIGYVADLDPAAVTKEDVKPLLAKLYAEKPVIAEDIRQRLAKVLSYAKATDRITTPGWENPVKWEDNLEHTLDRGAHTAVHLAALPFAEVGQFVADVRAGARASALLMALEWHVISATRPGEACGADWSEFDWSADAWVIPAERMKMRRPHRVPLTARHHAILDAILLGRQAPSSGPVFVARRNAAVSVPGLRGALLAIRPEGVTLHGFRSSFGTWARAETYSVTLPTGEVRKVRLYDEAMIEESLAHVVGGEVRNAYVRDDFLELRRPLLEAWATYCGTVQEKKVIHLRRRAA